MNTKSALGALTLAAAIGAASTASAEYTFMMMMDGSRAPGADGDGTDSSLVDDGGGTTGDGGGTTGDGGTVADGDGNTGDGVDLSGGDGGETTGDGGGTTGDDGTVADGGGSNDPLTNDDGNPVSETYPDEWTNYPTDTSDPIGDNWVVPAYAESHPECYNPANTNMLGDPDWGADPGATVDLGGNTGPTSKGGCAGRYILTQSEFDTINKGNGISQWGGSNYSHTRKLNHNSQEYTYGYSGQDVFTGQVEVFSTFSRADENYYRFKGPGKYYESKYDSSDRVMNYSSLSETVWYWDTSSAKDFSGAFSLRNSSDSHDMNVVIERAQNNNSRTACYEGVQYWNTANVEDMSYAFAVRGYRRYEHDGASNTIKMNRYEDDYIPNGNFVCDIDKPLDLSGWDTGNVTTMRGMFRKAPHYGHVPTGIAGWDVSNVTDMAEMFERWIDFKETGFTDGMDQSRIDDLYYLDNSFPDIGSWDVSSVETMDRMFYENMFVNDIDLGGWETSSLLDVESMFNTAEKYLGIGIDNWDVSNVENFSRMFIRADDVNQPVYNWDVSSGINFTKMFEDAWSYNQPINWAFVADPSKAETDTSKGASYMFRDAKSYTHGLPVRTINDNPDLNLSNDLNCFKFLNGDNSSTTGNMFTGSASEGDASIKPGFGPGCVVP